MNGARTRVPTLEGLLRSPRLFASQPETERAQPRAVTHRLETSGHTVGLAWARYTEDGLVFRMPPHEQSATDERT